MEPTREKTEWKIYRVRECECVIAGYAPQVEQIKLCFSHKVWREQIRQNAPKTFQKLVDEITLSIE